MSNDLVSPLGLKLLKFFFGEPVRNPVENIKTTSSSFEFESLTRTAHREDYDLACDGDDRYPHYSENENQKKK